MISVMVDTLLFPSPYGDMVLKWQGRLEVRSVPLRGYGFEIRGHSAGLMEIYKFPSPCGDMVLKFLAAGCLAVSGSICRFAARMRSPSFSRRNRVLKTAVYPTALSAVGISLSV